MVIFFKKIKSKKGSFLIESIVSVSLVVVGLLGIITFVTKSIVLNNAVRERFIAAALAAEGIEIVKNIIDTNNAQRLPWGTNINSGLYELSYDCYSLTCINTGWELQEVNEVFLNREIQPLKFNNGVYNYASGLKTNFKRVIRVEEVSETEIKVNSYVQWQTRGQKAIIDVEDHFYKWREQ